jgi:type II secretory pathway component PulJ
MRRARPAGDAGATLLDVAVSMSIMSLFMAIFTTGVLQMFRSANKAESLSITQAQGKLAFQRLGAQVRYAAAISTPGTVGADTYVEFLITSTGQAVCTELRLRASAGQLQRRTWVQGALPLTPSAWLPLAYGVTSAQPFTVTAADSAFSLQRLRLRLTASAGAGRTATTLQTDVTFTGLNTSAATAAATTCTEGRVVP